MNKIMFVCHGNICRSPMAEFLMKDLVQKKGESQNFEIKSSATSSEELGNPVHYGTKGVLDRLGISCKGKYAVKLTKSDYDNFDYFIGMDEYNIRNMLRIFGSDPDNKICKLLDFTSRKGDVADPWYSGNFTQTYRDVSEGVEALYEFIKNK